MNSSVVLRGLFERRSTFLVALIMAMLAGGSGCGSKAVDVDTKPFETAITKYLSQRSMGMKVTEFLKVTMDGASAEAYCKLQDAEGLYAMSVSWKFLFQKQGDGWEVTSHVQDARP